MAQYQTVYNLVDQCLKVRFLRVRSLRVRSLRVRFLRAQFLKVMSLGVRSLTEKWEPFLGVISHYNFQL